MFDRRSFLLASTAAAAATGVPAFAQGKKSDLHKMFDSFFQEGLRLRPEGATQLGLDTGANADLRGKLSDASVAGRAAQRALTQGQFRRLAAIDRKRLSPREQIEYDTVMFTNRSAASLQRFDFGSGGGGPYVVSQRSGAYQQVPDFLDTKHPLKTSADAEAYLARVSGFAVQLDQQTERVRHDAGMGVILPDFLLATTLDQLGKTRVAADKSVIVTSLAKRAAAAGLGAGYADSAAKIYTDAVLPALERQIAAIEALKPKATSDAGVWRFKDGAAYYQASLTASTTRTMTAAEVHAFGLDEAKRISARLDGLLKKQGLTKGTVGERMAALYKDPAQLYPNTDAGKVDAIAYCNERLAAIKTRLPQVFSRMPEYKFEVRRVPANLEAGASSAYSQRPSLDGKLPGLVYFNLADSAEWPKFCLATTIYHEGLPGHQFEGGLQLSNADLPLLLKTGGFSGYSEGWALYSEQVADEIGMYEDDPFGQLGYLKFQLFRANRCVVDTGIHTMRWTRQQAIDHFVAAEGEARGFATREVERYVGNPGQACSYKIGHTTITTLREKAKAALGAKFDLKAFHDMVLNTGNVPLDVLNGAGTRWMAAARG